MQTKNIDHSKVQLIDYKLTSLVDSILPKYTISSIEKVNDSFYRGSSPSVADFPKLAEKGIKKILNLRCINQKEFEQLSQEAKKYGMNYVNIPIGWINFKKQIPDIMNVLKGISKENSLFVHCSCGIDRTGIVTLLERCMIEGMSSSRAFVEMKSHGFDYLHRFLFFNMEQTARKFVKRFKK